MNPRAVTALTALVVGAILSPGAMAEDAPRLPRPRPAIEPPAAVSEWAADAASHFAGANAPKPDQTATAAIEELAPLPRPRPKGPAATLAMVAPEEQSAPPAPELAPASGESDAEFTACIGELHALGVEFEVAEPIDDKAGCTVPHPLKVTGLGSGVAIGPETLLNCAMTRALAEWMRDVVVPAGARTLRVVPDSIRQDSAYVCRNRYNDPNAKISEHAHANAIDIAEIGFAGRDGIGIGRNAAGSPEADFEAAIRAGSCRYFTTVLGPGSNAAHATHFHFDLAERRGGYRLCELGEPSKMVRAPENTKRE